MVGAAFCFSLPRLSFGALSATEEGMAHTRSATSPLPMPTGKAAGLEMVKDLPWLSLTVMLPLL